MVNGLQRKKSVVVKYSSGGCSEHATAKGGLGAVEAFARRTGLWSLCERLLPGRKGRNQGFTTTAVVSSAIHGLISGGCGFAATEPMRGDVPLLKMLGVDRAPSAETVEEVTKYLASCDGHEGLQEVSYRQCRDLVKREKRRDLMTRDGFIAVWCDGSLLEVEGKNFEAQKTIGGKRGQLVTAAFVGPYMVASDFADVGECELELSRGFLRGRLKRFLTETNLLSDSLVLLDSLYGDGPTLDLLETELAESRHVVGVNKLAEADKQMALLGDGEWRQTGTSRGRGWVESAVCAFWLQCEGWQRKRLCVGRRWKTEGDMFYHYAAVVTNLERDDPRVVGKMQREGLKCFEEAIWSLYDEKQAMENNWKSLLSDMGLHHPVSAKVQASAVFFAFGMLAYNLTVGFRRLTLEGSSRSMRLWRLRRDVIDMAARAATHARAVVVHILDARQALVTQLHQAMQRLARL